MKTKNSIKEQIEDNLLTQRKHVTALKELDKQLIQLHGEVIEQSRISFKKKFNLFLGSLTEQELEVADEDGFQL